MAEPITTTELAIHLRLDDMSSPLDDETELSEAILAARQNLEHFLARSIVQQTLRYYCVNFPGADVPILLPHGPVQSVTSIAYEDSSGTTQAFSTFDLRGDYVMPTIASGSWPGDVSNRPRAVTITYVAGHEGQSPGVPATLKRAMLMHAGDLFTNRLGNYREGGFTPNATLENLLSRYRQQMGL